MAWAGIQSENLATVWLLYHLCDKLDLSQFRQIAEKAGLTRREDESDEQYKTRMRDVHGIVVNKEALSKAVFEEAKAELTTDLIFDGEEDELEALKMFTLDEFSDAGIHRGLSPNTIEKLTHGIQKHHREMSLLNPYDFRVLSKINDFRVLVGLKYVVSLARKMGIYSKLADVLSFPLGSNSISILEASMAYHTILSGKVYRIGPNGSGEFIPVIQEIVDRNGETIYRYEPKGIPVLDGKVSNMVLPILRETVKRGTGKRAEGAVVVQIDDFRDSDFPEGVSFKLPAFGKTGTSNDFTNSSFCGFIPGPMYEEKGLTIQNSYVIASYIGYDNNRPLESKHIKIYGSSGALPIWIDVANAIVEARRFSEHIDPVDLVFQEAEEVPLPESHGMIQVDVNPLTSLPVMPDANQEELGEFIKIPTYGRMDQTGFIPERLFLPFP